MSKFLKLGIDAGLDQELKSYSRDTDELRRRKFKSLDDTESAMRSMNERLMFLGNRRDEVIESLKKDFPEHYGLLAVTRLWHTFAAGASTTFLNMLRGICESEQPDSHFVREVVRLARNSGFIN